jgi:AcrR family transcriptional regulator
MPSVETRATERKSDVLDAAATLFGERGFADVGMHDIAEQIGLTAGAIYRHFPGKEAVLEAVLDDAVGAFLEAADFSTPSNGGPPLERALRATTQLVVERAPQVATYIRERHRIATHARSELPQREALLFRQWSSAILASRPGLSMADVVIRAQALFGVLSALALRSGRLAQPRVRAAIIDGLIAVATADAPPPTPDAPSARLTWRPPVPRRDQIMTAAVHLFAEQGYHGVTMAEIGDSLGMSAPSLYEHFASKADILVDAFDRASAYVIAGSHAAVASATSASDAVERVIRSYVSIAFAHVDLCVVTSREGTALPASEQERLLRQQRDLHEQWSVVLREVRSDLSVGDARALPPSSVALVSAIARGRRNGKPSIDATVALARAFLLGPARAQRGGAQQEN